MVTKWAGSIEIGVTTHAPSDLEFPSTMTNVSDTYRLYQDISMLSYQGAVWDLDDDWERSYAQRDHHC